MAAKKSPMGKKEPEAHENMKGVKKESMKEEKKEHKKEMPKKKK